MRSQSQQSIYKKLVSIHAPARGAIVGRSSIWKTQSFNSRTREGCDLCVLLRPSAGIVSIHAPARGAIPKGAKAEYEASFNSRTREGCDDGKKSIYDFLLVSIHAPARGAINNNK